MGPQQIDSTPSPFSLPKAETFSFLISYGPKNPRHHFTFLMKLPLRVFFFSSLSMICLHGFPTHSPPHLSPKIFQYHPSHSPILPKPQFFRPPSESICFRFTLSIHSPTQTSCGPIARTLPLPPPEVSVVGEAFPSRNFTDSPFKISSRGRLGVLRGSSSFVGGRFVNVSSEHFNSQSAPCG